MRELTLQEECCSLYPASQLDQAEALAFLNAGPRFEVGFPTPAAAHYSIRPKGYVGYFPIAPGLAARVHPKVAISAVLAMLDAVYTLDLDAYREGTFAAVGIDGLAHSLAAVLAQRILDRCRRGLYGRYVHHREALPVVRGRILLRRTLSRPVTTPRIECSFDRFSRDVLENQGLLWTLHLIARSAMPERLQLPLARATRALRGDVSLRPVTAAELSRLVYHRLNADYAGLHALCCLFLDRLTPGLDAGPATAIPFSLYMPSLFQNFVAAWLRSRLPASLVVSTQVDQTTAGSLAVRLKPDLVIADHASGRALLVIDAKYKFGDRPSQGDIFQAAAYAAHWRVPQAILLYPEGGHAGTAHIGATVVRTASFDLSLPPAVWGQDCLGIVMATALGSAVRPG